MLLSLHLVERDDGLFCKWQKESDCFLLLNQQSQSPGEPASLLSLRITPPRSDVARFGPTWNWVELQFCKKFMFFNLCESLWLMKRIYMFCLCFYILGEDWCGRNLICLYKVRVFYFYKETNNHSLIVVLFLKEIKEMNVSLKFLVNIRERWIMSPRIVWGILLSESL